ncbi:hypothetical protein ACNKHN_06975 [Shigella flexneri]
MANIIRLLLRSEPDSDPFGFSRYFKFLSGHFALVYPVGIIPVFISMTSYQQTAAARNKNWPYSQPVCGHYLVDFGFSRRHDSTTFWYIN